MMNAIAGIVEVLGREATSLSEWFCVTFAGMARTYSISVL
jgi:hypothetical protein